MLDCRSTIQFFRCHVQVIPSNGFSVANAKLIVLPGKLLENRQILFAYAQDALHLDTKVVAHIRALTRCVLHCLVSSQYLFSLDTSAARRTKIISLVALAHPALNLLRRFFGAYIVCFLEVYLL